MKSVDQIKFAAAIAMLSSSLMTTSVGNSQSSVSILDSIKKVPVQNLSIINKALLDSSLAIQSERDSLIEILDSVLDVQSKTAIRKEKIISKQDADYRRLVKIKQKIQLLNAPNTAFRELQIPPITIRKTVVIDTANVSPLPEITVPCERINWFNRNLRKLFKRSKK